MSTFINLKLFLPCLDAMRKLTFQKLETSELDTSKIRFKCSVFHTPYPSKQTLLVLFLYVKNKMAPKNKMACRKKASSKVTSMDYYFENVLAV